MIKISILTAAAIILILLASVAGVLVYKVYQQNKIRRNLLQQQELAIGEQRKRVNTSIQLLAQATHNDELTLTEASIRISVLLDSLAVSDEVRNEFSAFYQLRGLTEHIPFLDGWKKLNRKQQDDFDLQRLQHEASYRDFVLDAARRIKGRNF